jgi:hypothetical protein
MGLAPNNSRARPSRARTSSSCCCNAESAMASRYPGHRSRTIHRWQVCEAHMLHRRVRGRLRPRARTPDRERIRIHADNAARDPGRALHKKSFTASHVEDMAAVPGGDIDQPGMVGAVVVLVVIHWLLVCATTDQQRSAPLRMSRESAAGWRDRLLSTACSASQARALIGATTSRLVGLWLIQASSGGTVPTLRLFGYQPIHQISPRLFYKRAAPW